MFRRYPKCYCMNNTYNTNNSNCKEENEVLETSCNSVCSYVDDDIDSCSCGFDEETNVFSDNPMLGQSYVPIQQMDRTFKPCVGLRMGTIFPELVSPYSPGQSMQQIDYIRNSNTIGKGCNKC